MEKRVSVCGHILAASIVLFSSAVSIADTNESKGVVLYNSNPEIAVPTKQILKLTTWNTQKYNGHKSLLEVTRLGRESDFLLLQEALFSPVFAGVFSRLNAKYWIGQISFMSNPKTGTGVQSGSRYKTSGYQGLLSNDLEPVVATAKAMMVVYYPLAESKAELAVANLHAVNFVRTQSLANQLKQLSHLLREHKGPLIVAGDFNTHLPQRFTIVRRFAEDLGLYWVPITQDRRTMKLDHVLVRGVEVVGARVRTDIVTSDHYPLTVDFKISNQ